jgi:translation initiation factor eIF-2B subunit delta
MANLWNLTGRLLRLADSERNKLGKVEEFRESIQGVCRRLLEMVEQCSEEVSRTSVGLLPRDGSVLTHSYSSSVCRALELGFKGGRGFKVYVTESYPGMEGKQLAKDLIALGIPVTLIADSAVSSILPSVSFVLVGADGVLQDGSLIHKIGTRYVASESKRLGIPFYSSCETVKFSTQDFLGERPEISSSLFDLTPPEFVSGYITEEGELAPDAVAGRIVELQKEIYP